MKPSIHKTPPSTIANIWRSARNCMTRQKGESSSPRCAAKSSNMSGSWFMALMVLAFGAEAVPPTFSPVDHSQYAAVAGAAAARVADIHGGSWVSARSDQSLNTGVHTVYIYVDALGAALELGVANAVAPLNGWLGQDLNAVGYRYNGNVQKNSAWANPVPLPPAFTTGDTLGMQVDTVAHTARFNKNYGTWSGPVDITCLGANLYVGVSVGLGTSVHILPASDWGGPVVNFVMTGDSLAQGFGDQEGVAQRLADLIRTNKGEVSWTKAGIPGATWNYTPSSPGLAFYPYTLIQDAPIRVDPERVTDIPSWLIAWAGTNGSAIYHRTAAQECADAKTWADSRVATGWLASSILLEAMLPRTGVDDVTFRTPYNTCLRTLGYTVVPLDLDPTIGATGRNLDPTCFPDGVHPSDSCAQIAAQITYSTIYP